MSTKVAKSHSQSKAYQMLTFTPQCLQALTATTHTRTNYWLCRNPDQYRQSVSLPTSAT